MMRELNWQSLEVQTDTQVMVGSINGKSVVAQSEPTIKDRIVIIFELNFDLVRFVGRCRNNEAHKFVIFLKVVVPRSGLETTLCNWAWLPFVMLCNKAEIVPKGGR